jgi:hypothetical protein
VTPTEPTSHVAAGSDVAPAGDAFGALGVSDARVTVATNARFSYVKRFIAGVVLAQS